MPDRVCQSVKPAPRREIVRDLQSGAGLRWAADGALPGLESRPLRRVKKCIYTLEAVSIGIRRAGSGVVLGRARPRVNGVRGNNAYLAQVISWKPSHTNWAQTRFSANTMVGNSEPMFSSILKPVARWNP